MINTSTHSSVGRVAIARPEKKNALTAAMYQQMADAIGAAERDPGVRAILICGTADVFTAGNDLEDFAKRPTIGASPAFVFMKALKDAEKPVVAAVAGAAVGIGTTMLLHCDLVYAAETARFSVPFVALGLCSEFASSFLLPLRAGHGRASEKLLLAEPFDAAEAMEMGLVTRVVPGDVIAHAQGRAERLAQLPSRAVRTTKRLMKHAHNHIIDEMIAMEGDEFRALLQGDAAKEAIAAFFEKRKPDFSRF